MTNNRPTVVAVYCPLWHRYPHMDSWKGEGWNEWELLKTAPPRFEGHHQPLQPTWGCFDESDPQWSAKEIDLAADHGIDVFLFDWYWYSGVKLMEEALENGFLRAPNNQRLRFALMWANHTWADYFPAPFDSEWNLWLPQRHSAADTHNVIRYATEHYFTRPNYWRLDDKLFFSIFDPAKLIAELGGPEKTKQIFREIDKTLHSRGLPGLHWNAMSNHTDKAAAALAAGFHSATSYNVIETGKLTADDEPIEQYEDVMQAHREHWAAMARVTGAHFPVVTMGWDVTPRTLHDAPWPFEPPLNPGNRAFPFDAPRERNRVYPYIHVVVNNTPDRFEQLCRDARQHLQETASPYPVVLLNAWNEWTEGCYLLPEARYGEAYVQAVRNVYGMAKDSEPRR